MCHVESPRFQCGKSAPNVPADPRGVVLVPVLVNLSARSSGRRAIIRQESKIGTAAPRDTVALGGADEDTPREEPLPVGLSERRLTAIASHSVSGA